LKRCFLQPAKTPTLEMIRDAGLVVTVGCSIEEACPKPMIVQMQNKLIGWHIDDLRQSLQ